MASGIIGSGRASRPNSASGRTTQAIIGSRTSSVAGRRNVFSRPNGCCAALAASASNSARRSAGPLKSGTPLKISWKLRIAYHAPGGLPTSPCWTSPCCKLPKPSRRMQRSLRVASVGSQTSTGVQTHSRLRASGRDAAGEWTRRPAMRRSPRGSSLPLMTKEKRLQELGRRSGLVSLVWPTENSKLKHASG